MVRRFAVVIMVLAVAGCVGKPGPETPSGEDTGTATGNGILEGSVVDENFVPIQGAVVRLQGTDHRVETSWNGHFRFTNLPPKLYRITVEAAGWNVATIDGRVQPDFATRLTIFLDPLADLAGYSTLQQLEGKLDCAEVAAGGTAPLPCEPQYYQTDFPADWAAMLIEVEWGPSGYSSSDLAEVTAGDLESKRVYADLVADSPAKIILLPSTLHDGIGGTDTTPEEGVSATLDVGIKKEPTRASEVGAAGATYDQSYQMYITTFYFQTPDDLADYTALPK